LFRPIPDSRPSIPKPNIGSHRSFQFRFKACKIEKTREIMTIDVPHKAPIRNFVGPKPGRNTRLYRALDRIASQVIGTRGLVFVQKQLSFIEPQARKLTEGFAIVWHHTATFALMCGCGS
jgi:hypothetical protein